MPGLKQMDIGKIGESSFASNSAKSSSDKKATADKSEKSENQRADESALADNKKKPPLSGRFPVDSLRE